MEATNSVVARGAVRGVPVHDQVDRPGASRSSRWQKSMNTAAFTVPS